MTTNANLFPKWYSYLLRNEIDKRIIPNPTLMFRKTFEDQLQIKVVQPKQTEAGFEMFFRCPSISAAEELWNNYTMGSLGEVFKSMLWYPELSQELNVENVEIHTHIDQKEFRNYVDIFLAFQGMWQSLDLLCAFALSN